MEKKKMYLQKDFEELIELLIDQPTSGLVSNVEDKCKSVTAINGFSIFYNQGMEGNCVVTSRLNGLQVILPNLALFENLKQLVLSKCASYPYMEFWPESLEQVTLNDDYDLSNLNRLPNLHDLALRYHEVDLAAIRPIAEQLTSLAFNSAKDEEEIGNFINLELLTYGAQKGSFAHFSKLKKLRRLFVEEYNYSTLDGIENCKALEMLRIQCSEKHRLADISALASLPNLHELTFIRNHVMDISPLSGLPLEKLALDQVPLLDFSPLGEITTLKELSIQSCLIDDLSVLEGLENLEVLTLADTQVKDFSPLLKLPKLRKVVGCDSRDFPKELQEKLGIHEPAKKPRIEYNPFEARAFDNN